jgi:septal ring factor EnvC (AmiA/AmiB activator)
MDKAAAKKNQALIIAELRKEVGRLQRKIVKLEVALHSAREKAEAKSQPTQITNFIIPDNHRTPTKEPNDGKPPL